MTVTRGCSRSDQSSSPYATSSAITCSAPACSRQSVKPPVEAPTSRQRRPAGSTPSASSALRSLIPPRETYGGGASTPSSTSGSTSWPGLAALASPGPSRTWPAITAAAARLRDAKSPRSASRESRRTRATGANGRRSGMCPLSQTFRPDCPILVSVIRSISLPLHSALELLGGLALLAGPFLLGAGPAGLVAAVSLGALVVGLALAGPDALPISAHQSFDLMLVAALAGGALALAVSGDPAGGLVLAVVGALELALLSLTRWVRA